MDDDLRSRYRISRGDYSRPVHRPGRQKPRQAPQLRTAVDEKRPEIEPARPSANAHRRLRRRLFKRLILFMVFIAVMGGAGAFTYLRFKDKNPFPANIQTNAQVLLFYPDKLPSGFIIEPSSMHFVNGALIYDAKDGQKRLVFTTQRTPPNYDYKTFYKQDLKQVREMKSVYGKAVVGKYQDRYLGSLVSGNTWLLLSTNSPDVSVDDMSLVISNLKRY